MGGAAIAGVSAMNGGVAAGAARRRRSTRAVPLVVVAQALDVFERFVIEPVLAQQPLGKTQQELPTLDVQSDPKSRVLEVC